MRKLTWYFIGVYIIIIIFSHCNRKPLRRSVICSKVKNTHMFNILDEILVVNNQSPLELLEV